MLEINKIAAKLLYFPAFRGCGSEGAGTCKESRKQPELFYQFSFIEIEFPHQLIGQGREEAVHENSSFAGKG